MPGAFLKVILKKPDRKRLIFLNNYFFEKDKHKKWILNQVWIKCEFSIENSKY
jgi:hypothetical protein